MDKKSMIKFFVKSAKQERKDKENYTYWQTLDIIDDKEFAIVMGWQDGFDTEDGWELCMKLAYLPTNSLMSEYNIDWIMPYDEETGEVIDVEMTVGNNKKDIENHIEYLLGVYDVLCKEGVLV